MRKAAQRVKKSALVKSVKLKQKKKTRLYIYSYISIYCIYPVEIYNLVIYIYIYVATYISIYR